MGYVKTGSEFQIGAAVGSGASALAAELGGADFLLAINAGRLRNMGAPSIACMLPTHDATGLTESFAETEVLALCSKPVMIGVNCWGAAFDPAGQAMRLKEAGFAGAVNFPSCMHYTRPMQQILSRAGRGIEQEVELLKAVQDAGLTSIFYCATRTQARLAADAGLDMICLNFGWNVGGAFGHRQRASIEEIAVTVHEVRRLVQRISPKTRLFLEGGPIGTADDLAAVRALVEIDGYIGGSTIERTPLETSVAGQIEAFRTAGGRQGSGRKDANSQLLAWGRQRGVTGMSPPVLGMLRRLKSLAAVAEPLALVSEPGCDRKVLYPALLPGSPGLSRDAAIQHVDVAGDDYPARARRLLFGQADAGASRRPMLGDTDIAMVVIHAADRLPPGIQRRLARTLRQGTFRMTGQSRPVPVHPRIVFDFESHAVDAGSVTLPETLMLDEDLRRILDGWALVLPPLRSRVDDLEQLLIAADPALDRSRFSLAAWQLLESHEWPGNEAELHQLVGSLADLDGRQTFQPIDIQSRLSPVENAGFSARTEKERIVEALWRHGFSRTRTADALGISRKTLYNKIRRYGLSA
jgi:predicted TIM-barrel enzyme